MSGGKIKKVPTTIPKQDSGRKDGLYYIGSISNREPCEAQYGISSSGQQRCAAVYRAFDKQDAYTTETRKIVSDNQVLKLSNNHCELYGQSWNVEEAQNEDEL